MVGSPNFARLIYDGDGSAFDTAGPKGSDEIEHTFAKYFKREDLPTGETAFDGRSDYLAFITVGIPSGGLFSGAEEIKTKKEQKLYGGKAGKPYDACYHQACDDIDNVSQEVARPDGRRGRRLDHDLRVQPERTEVGRVGQGRASEDRGDKRLLGHSLVR